MSKQQTQPEYRITVSGRIAVALMPDLHGDALVAATNRVSKELASELRMAESHPDLLAACEAALTLMPIGEYTPAQEAGQETLRIRTQLRAAIAKAKGCAA